MTSAVTSIECVELYPVKLGRSDSQGSGGKGWGGGETQAPTEKYRIYLSECDGRPQLLGIEERKNKSIYVCFSSLHGV